MFRAKSRLKIVWLKIPTIWHCEERLLRRSNLRCYVMGLLRRKTCRGRLLKETFLAMTQPAAFRTDAK
jgi:hypothetical protein